MLLIDVSPDFRAQTLTAGINRIDAVLVTHAHFDHIGGLGDLRAASWRGKGAIPIHAGAETLEALRTRFGYAFADVGESYAPFLEACEFVPLTGYAHEVAGFSFLAFEQVHGDTRTLGYRIGDFAYSTDVSALPAEAWEVLDGVRTWVVGCLDRRSNPRHAHLERVLEWIARLKPQCAVLTHMGPGLDYATLAAELPEGVVPAHDGMVLELPS